MCVCRVYARRYVIHGPCERASLARSARVCTRARKRRARPSLWVTHRRSESRDLTLVRPLLRTLARITHGAARLLGSVRSLLIASQKKKKKNEKTERKREKGGRAGRQGEKKKEAGISSAWFQEKLCKTPRDYFRVPRAIISKRRDAPSSA